MIRFRPYPGLTIAGAIAFAILVWLGVWQLQRLQWKLALIATVQAHMVAPPISLDQALRMNADDVQYRRVALAGRFDNGKEAYLFTTGPSGEPAYHVLTPFISDDGKTMLVDRGLVPEDKRPAASRIPVDGPTRIVAVWRVPDPPNGFTPVPDPARHVWYAHDMAGLARASGVSWTAPVVLEADSHPNPGGWPKGGQTVVSFRNEHLQYALTWFGLAAGLLGVYLAYHVSKGRLSFGGKGQ